MVSLRRTIPHLGVLTIHRQYTVEAPQEGSVFPFPCYLRQLHLRASFAWEVKENSGHVAVFNVEESEGTGKADFFFLGGCEMELPNAVGIDGDVEAP